VPTPTKDFKALVGKHVRIERDGVIHQGVLMGEVYIHLRAIRFRSNVGCFSQSTLERGCSRLTSKRMTAGP
jgi:hypothetical protein